MRQVVLSVLAGVVSLTVACDDRNLSPPPTQTGATGMGGAGGASADSGAHALPPDGLFVTMEDAAGNETVFRDGYKTAAACGDRLSALVEPACPHLSMVFDVHNPEFPINILELYVQGAYGFVMRSDGVLHSRTVSEIAIDAQDGDVVRGHYRLSLDAAPGPATDVWGQFALCSEAGSTVEPCRNMF